MRAVGFGKAIVAVFTAQVFGIDLNWTDYITLVLVSIISSIGVAGVPGPAVISTTVVLTALGMPLEGIAIVAGVEALIDMGSYRCKRNWNSCNSSVSS